MKNNKNYKYDIKSDEHYIRQVNLTLDKLAKYDFQNELISVKLNIPVKTLEQYFTLKKEIPSSVWFKLNQLWYDMDQLDSSYYDAVYSEIADKARRKKPNILNGIKFCPTCTRALVQKDETMFCHKCGQNVGKDYGD